MLKTPDVIGNISPSRVPLMQKDAISVRPVAPFHRMKDVKAREAHEVTMILLVQEIYNCLYTPGGIANAHDYPQNEF
ncbi:hypothetical protein AZE42_09206 [Rhizopogon vesiculosus]|uniref:Uncharacterized protein n=1 Tax=Rhizopogon vesiculosus TaxID=180088 RepID=A0A1J8Q265_9AGAM|nr:hypothetical protein AZE42_09206 [Rhizopogon vesiculosus]